MEGRRGGRGEALRKLLQRDSVPVRSPGALTERPESSSSQPLRPSGRSAFFAQVARQKDDVSSQSPEAQPCRRRAVLTSRREPPETERLSQHLSHLKVTEGEPVEPVIMKGTTGREASLAVNYVRLKVAEGKGLFQYDVQYDPPVDSRGARHGLLNDCKNVIGDTKLFDGAILYLPFRLPQKTTVLRSKLKSDGSNVTVTITFIKHSKLGDSEAIHLYNILFRKIMVLLGLALHGENFYDPKAAMPIPLHKLEVWPGYITSISEFEDGLMLCCDASHRVLRNQTVLELLEDLEKSNRQGWKDEFVNLILGQSVLTRYNNKLYRIDDISFDESPRDSFLKGNGEMMTYMEYYKQQYNIQIRDAEQPLLKSKTKRKFNGREIKSLVSLLPELCYLTGITDAMRADMRVMKDITHCICVNPNQRHYAISQFIKNIRESPEASKILSDWGLSLDTAYMHLPGRILPPLDITFGRNISARGTAEASWNGPANKNHCLTAIDLKQWAVVCLKRDDKAVFEFVDQMMKFSPNVGIKIQKPEIVCMSDDRTDNYIRTLRSILTKGQPLQAVMVVFPLARNDKYSAVKKLCCIEEPIPSQGILTRTVRKAATARAIILKVALQINCKLGGTLWSVRIPVVSTMVCGLDTYHDPRRKANSVCALVSSINESLTRWYSKVFVQAPGLEVMNGLEVCMSAALHRNREVAGSFPQQIIVFRDGVSDGQLPAVKKFELPQIMKACQQISPDYEPRILFIVVQKRINTRLFSADQRDGYGNPPPGTVLDHTVTRRYLYDFFLVSQHVTQGTVSPTHFIVVHNTTNMNPDQVQRFSYTLTHLYYNWPGTIRVPAPCQYAHKLAFLVGECLHKEASEVLEDKLFYL